MSLEKENLERKSDLLLKENETDVKVVCEEYNA